MKKHLLFLAVMLVCGTMHVGCKPDSLFDGHFYMQVNVVNNTGSELVLEHHETSGDFNVTKHIQNGGSETLAFGEYGGSKNDDYPPEEVAVEALQDVRIYRNTNGEPQELPNSWFNNLNAFEISKEYWFSDCIVTYQISITDEMFSE